MRPTTSIPRMKGGSTGKRETPSRTSTSRWFSAQAATSISTSPGPGLRIGHVLELKDVEPAELVKHDCLHVRPPWLESEQSRLYV